ncbi:MAG: methyltransferase domain-containing protein [Ferruginibacter sp.]
MQLPDNLLANLKNIPGFDRQAFIDIHNSEEKITSFRLNPHKTKNITSAEIFEGIEMRAIPWSIDAFYLSTRPSFTLDPLFHAGAYYVQEASSMFLEQALRQSIDLGRNLNVLDACAAPGGKSTHIQSLISAESILVSNEVIKSRVSVLAENITKWGADNVVVTNNDTRDFNRLPEYFDVIVVDAPCSGSGLFRKDPNAIKEWGLEQVGICSRRQQSILQDLIPSLKPGGILIYSTCSYSAEEDEAISDFLVQMENLISLPLQVNPEWKIVTSYSPGTESPGYRFYPDKLEGEGFYLSVFQKPGELKKNDHNNGRPKFKLLSAAEKVITGKFILLPPPMVLFHFEKSVIAISYDLFEELTLISRSLYIRQAGIEMGNIIRNEFIPHHALALSKFVSPEVYRIELNREDALEYLRRNIFFPLSEDTGWVLVSYKEIALGWIKVLPGRINNYYPKSWRILHK